jgi:hypothetical protein
MRRKARQFFYADPRLFRTKNAQNLWGRLAAPTLGETRSTRIASYE